MIVFDNGTTQVEHLAVPNAKGLVVNFNHYLSNDITERGFGVGLSHALGYDVLSVKPRESTWYNDVSLNAFSDIMEHIPRYDDIVSYGSSMGGYACAFFGRAIKANRAIMVSPQYSVDQRQVPWEARWQKESGSIRFDHPPIAKVAYKKTDYYVLYDPLDTNDRRHAEMIAAAVGRAIRIKTPFSGHVALDLIVELGLASKVMGALITNTFDVNDFRRVLRERKRESFAYHVNFAHVATHRRKKLGDYALKKAEELVKGEGHRAKLEAIKASFSSIPGYRKP